MQAKLSKSRLALVLTPFLLMTFGCAAPILNSLTPSNGPERTIVQVDGSTFLSGVLWDAGTPQERFLPSGFLGAGFFSVPPGATVGAHNVQLLRSGNRSGTLPFTVTNPVPFTTPRADYVMLFGTSFEPGNKIITWMLVQGANVDVGAEVLVNGAVQPTISFKALINDLYGVAPATLGFPIYHYTALLCTPGERTAGEVLQIQIRNLDNQISNTLNYTLPTDAASLDSDGDNIPDQWEISGYDADGDGTIDVDLPGIGASPYRRDILVELDVMSGLTNPPTAATFQAITNAFAAAPILNLSPDNGINLILNSGGSVPFSQTINLTGADDPTVGFTNFYTLKTNNFNNDARGRIYHYAIWANAHPSGWSGVSDVDINVAGTQFVGPGDDFIVSFDDFPAAYHNNRNRASTFMHELGHNLIQRHGGGDHSNKKPNYNSVMSYSWQLRTGLTNATRRSRPVCFPFFYAQNGAVEINGALVAGFNNVIDYSEGMGATLNEANLNEAIGVCNNIAVDWNNDGDTFDANVSVDADQDGTANEILQDYCNWCNLLYTGPELNGEYGN